MRLSVVLQLHGHPLLQPVGLLDSGVAVDLARELANGDLLLRGATAGQPFFFAPLYVYFLGVVFALGGTVLAAQVAQALLGGAAVVLLARAARPWLGEPAALVAGVLLALTGPVVFHEAILLQSALDPFLTALALLAVGRAASRPAAASAAAGALAWLLGGAAIGLLALNRPNALAWGVALAACLPLIAARGERWRALVAAAAVVAGLGAAILPATLRNVVVSGEPVLVSSHGGLNFYIGNRAEADGTYRAVPGITPDVRGQARDARRLAEQHARRALSARETDAHFRALAWEWIFAHPLDAAALFARKLAYLLGATELALNYSYAYYASDEPTLLRLLPVGAWLLVPLGLVGLADRARLGPRGFLAWAVVVPAYGLSVAAFFVSSRYRLPLLVPLAAGAGFALVRLAQLAPARDVRPLARRALALLALAAVTFWPHRLDDGRSAERAAMLLWLVDNGRPDEAAARLGRLSLPQGTDAASLLLVGNVALQVKRPDLALRFLETGLAQDRGSADLHEKRGLALLMLDRPGEARGELEQARRLDPASASACLNLAVLEAQEGRLEKARALAGEALRLEPGYAQARGLLEALERVR